MKFYFNYFSHIGGESILIVYCVLCTSCCLFLKKWTTFPGEVDLAYLCFAAKVLVAR